MNADRERIDQGVAIPYARSERGRRDTTFPFDRPVAPEKHDGA